VDRLTRKELKTDRFATEVGHTVEYLEEHRQQAIRYGIIAFAILLIAGGTYYYLRHQRGVRQQMLAEVMQIMDAPVGAPPGSASHTYATQQEKDQAVKAALTKLAAEHPGSGEGAIAKYYLAARLVQEGKSKEAEQLYREVADSAGPEYASSAKLTLAGLYASQNKAAEAEKLLRELIARPTVLVSKEQATIELARVLAPSKPQEARKLLEPLRTGPSAVSRTALTELGKLEQK
jgi:predicted negative regulator of RcsB-dependent stress response